MLGVFKIKLLLFGLLLASPPVAAWILRNDPPKMQTLVNQTVPVSRPAHQTMTVPVEVVAKGSAPKVVYVEVTPQAIPEPGSVSLLALTGLLLLRRQRPGK